MDNNHLEENKVSYFEILGHKLKLRSQLEGGLDPHQVVAAVQQEIHLLKNQFPKLDPSQLAIMVSLKLAQDKLQLEKKFNEKLKLANLKANDILNHIDKITSFSTSTSTLSSTSASTSITDA
jgi:cell division protein ZapA (FtsZ GTPase activity inhibitor)